MSNNLNLTQVTGAQDTKEATINEQSGNVDAAITELYLADYTSGNVALTDAQYREHLVFRSTNLSVPRDLTLPAIKKESIIDNTAGTDTLSVIVGSTTIAVATLVIIKVYSDGTTNGLIQVGAASGGAASRYEMGGFVGGVVPTTSVVFRHLATQALDFAADLAESQAHLDILTDAQTDFDVQVNGSSEATIRFANATAVATFPTAAAFSMVAGDRIDIVSPADVNLAGDFSFTLVASKG